MRLDTYLDQEDLSPVDFASRLGVSRITVDRYLSGKRLPRREVMVSIVKATKGEVGPVDFYPHCAKLLRRYRRA